MTKPLDSGSLPISALTGDPVVRVAPTTSLRDLAVTMTTNNISAVCIGSDDSVVGIVSERDLVRAMATGLDPSITHAADLSQTELVWATPESTVQSVAIEMMTRWVRHVLVGEGGRLDGIVSARDLLGAFAASAEPEFD